MFVVNKKPPTYINVSGLLSRAVSETRTRDPQLGKLMLYQLSYYRILKPILHFGVQM